MKASVMSLSLFADTRSRLESKVRSDLGEFSEQL